MKTKRESFLCWFCLFFPQKVMRATRILFVLLWFFCVYFPAAFCANVTYDHRALVIDGKRRVLVSGSIHYPRSTPEVLLITLYVSVQMLHVRLLFFFFLPMFLKSGLKRDGVCCCRSGQTSFRNPKMEDLMWLRLMFSGTYMNQFKARFCFF